jgi:hypothetical protein
MVLYEIKKMVFLLTEGLAGIYSHLNTWLSCFIIYSVALFKLINKLCSKGFNPFFLFFSTI